MYYSAFRALFDVISTPKTQLSKKSMIRQEANQLRGNSNCVGPIIEMRLPTGMNQKDTNRIVLITSIGEKTEAFWHSPVLNRGARGHISAF